MWGIIPAAGEGKRIQPLAFSKELLPVGYKESANKKRPRAVSDFIVERLIIGGANKLCFVISPRKGDILQYHRAGHSGSKFMYLVQPEPLGLCDAVFRPVDFIGENEEVLIGLPDTVWFPVDGYALLPSGVLSFLLFPVNSPQHFDAVLLGEENQVLRVEVKQEKPSTHWIWGAIRMPGGVFRRLYDLWVERSRQDEYLGTLFNSWLERGNVAIGVKAGTNYLDVGTIDGLKVAFDHLMQNSTPANKSQIYDDNV
ncbi:MAG: nucleotidyltransferase family protein [Verrucomicrobia bacterium]|nr:nucleotidyltransferase family protein [Verrucomicrobiota bacterium]